MPHSIRRNTAYPNYEVIIVDNHSADGTLDLLRDYPALDEQIRITLLDSNKGFAAATNEAASRCQRRIFPDAECRYSGDAWMDRPAGSPHGHRFQGRSRVPGY